MISTRNAQEAFLPQNLQRFQHAMKMLPRDDSLLQKLQKKNSTWYENA
jgi:hypothetical protein